MAEVEEGQVADDIGVYVTTISARDYDDPTTPNAQLDWTITANKLLNDTPLFRIDGDGKLFLMVVEIVEFSDLMLDISDGTRSRTSERTRVQH